MNLQGKAARHTVLITVCGKDTLLGAGNAYFSCTTLFLIIDYTQLHIALLLTMWNLKSV